MGGRRARRYSQVSRDDSPARSSRLATGLLGLAPQQGRRSGQKRPGPGEGPRPRREATEPCTQVLVPSWISAHPRVALAPAVPRRRASVPHLARYVPAGGEAHRRPGTGRDGTGRDEAGRDARERDGCGAPADPSVAVRAEHSDRPRPNDAASGQERTMLGP